MLGYTASSLEIADLPILPAWMRAANIFSRMRRFVTSPRFSRSTTFLFLLAHLQLTLRIPFANYLCNRFPSLETRVPWIRRSKTFAPFRYEIPRQSSAHLLLQLIRANKMILLTEIGLAAVSALVFYLPAYFFRKFITWLENDPRRGLNTSRFMNYTENGGPLDTKWAWVYCAGIFGSTAVMYCKWPISRVLLIYNFHHLKISPSTYWPIVVYCHDRRSASDQDPAQYDAIR